MFHSSAELKTSLLCTKVLGTVATDPSHQGRGYASLLLKWGVQKSEEAKLNCYLESTVETVPLYKKYGFVVCDALSVEWSTSSSDGQLAHKYEEICMVRGMVRNIAV